MARRTAEPPAFNPAKFQCPDITPIQGQPKHVWYRFPNGKGAHVTIWGNDNFTVGFIADASDSALAEGKRGVGVPALNGYILKMTEKEAVAALKKIHDSAKDE